MAVYKEPGTQEVTASDDWSWSFEGLPKYADGKEIIYTVTEDRVEGYTSTVNGYNVTNSYKPGKVSVAVTKSWADNGNQDGKRPNSVTVELVADQEKTGKTVVLSTGNNWSGAFTELDEYKAGKKIAYSIEEVKVEGYETVITGSAANGYVITNSYTPEVDDGDEESAGRPMDNDTPPTHEDESGNSEHQVLPKTGLLWWAMPVLLCSGTALVSFGVKTKKHREDEEDNEE